MLDEKKIILAKYRLEKAHETYLTIRNKSDYEDFYVSSKEEANEQVKNALIFYETVSKYVEEAALIKQQNIIAKQ